MVGYHVAQITYLGSSTTNKEPEGHNRNYLIDTGGDNKVILGTSLRYLCGKYFLEKKVISKNYRTALFAKPVSTRAFGIRSPLYIRLSHLTDRGASKSR